MKDDKLPIESALVSSCFGFSGLSLVWRLLFLASKVSLQEFVLKKQGNSKQGLAVSQKNLFLLVSDSYSCSL